VPVWAGALTLVVSLAGPFWQEAVKHLRAHRP
jgi:hypothetical protein